MSKKTASSKAAQITRKQAVAELRALGYTGPVSYAMPKLRAIHAEQFAAASPAPVEGDVAETPQARRNRLQRERRAARRAAA